MLFMVGQLSHNEWQNPSVCNPDANILENQFTFHNSVWFVFASLMHQGIYASIRVMVGKRKFSNQTNKISF